MDKCTVPGNAAAPEAAKVNHARCPFLPLLVLATTMLAGCGAGMTGAELDASYLGALEESAGHARRMDEDPERLQAAVAGVREYFRDVTSASVRELTAQVYAPDAYLNDNLAAVRGADAIETYFLGAVESAAVLRIEFLATAVDGIDVYVRWRMHMEVPALNRGEPMISYGMTQFRFDEAGRALLHKDFWDSGSGFFEYMPVLGRVIRRLRPAH